MIYRAKELGMSGLAITNHDNLSEVIAINREQKKLRKNKDDFVLAIGNEIYLVDSFDPAVKERQKYYHFILVAKDKIGYDALIELSTRAWYRSAVQWGRRRVPTLKTDIEEVMATAKGHVVATTACLGGEFPTLVNAGKKQEAGDFLRWAQAQFGYDDFYIELQPSDSPDQLLFNKSATEYDAKFIIATDAHYQSKEDFPIFEAFLRSQQERREVQEYYAFARMMHATEILELMLKCGLTEDFVADCLENTCKIGQQIEFYDLAQKFHIPKVSVTVPELIVPKNLLSMIGGE